MREDVTQAGKGQPLRVPLSPISSTMLSEGAIQARGVGLMLFNCSLTGDSQLKWGKCQFRSLSLALQSFPLAT